MIPTTFILHNFLISVFISYYNPEFASSLPSFKTISDIFYFLEMIYSCVTTKPSQGLATSFLSFYIQAMYVC